MVELKGSLGSLGLPAIVQLIGELHHSGNLELTRGAYGGVLGFDDGRLVAASYHDQQGLKALAACTLALADGNFVFVEGLPSGERTLDLGGSELQKLFGRLVNGELRAETLDMGIAPSGEPASLGICPRLGFVDDATRQYSRATALHRCFAGETPSLVTSQEQRELCLSGRYPTCPRFRNNTTSSSVPAGVAARMAAASQLQMAETAQPGAETAELQPRADEPSGSRGARIGFRSERGLLLLAIGAGLGLVVLVGGLLLVVAVLSGGFIQRPASVAAPSFEPVPTVVRAPTTITRPTTVPLLAPTAPPQPATPTTRSVPNTVVPAKPTAAPVSVAPALASGAPAPGQPLIDVRFASGPSPGWLDSPPFATWSDGAYRLQAREPTHFVAVGVPIDRVPSDMVVSATLRKTGGPPGGGYGLIVRNQSPDPLNGVNQNGSAYVMEAGDRGEFGIWRRDGDHWVDLVPWTPSGSVRAGGSPNNLEVRAMGERLTFSVNGTELAAIQDDALPTGGVGVFVGGDYNEVALDRFTVQAPD